MDEYDMLSNNSTVETHSYSIITHNDNNSPQKKNAETKEKIKKDTNEEINKKKEEVAEALIKNDIVKTERALDRIEAEVKSTEEQIAQKSIPQNNNLKKLLPILAIGGIIYLILKKDSI